MSRRFGRNQKRRMRAEVAAAKAETALHAGVARDNAAARDRAQARALDIELLFEVTAGMVGRYALAAGVPTNFESFWLKTGKKNFRLPVPILASEVVSYGIGHAEKATMIHDEIMRLLEVEAIRSQVSRDMQVRVTFDDIAIGYALSDHALQHTPEDWLIERMTREIRPLLMDAIQELKRRAR